MKIIDAHMHYFAIDKFAMTAEAAGHTNSAACWQQICDSNAIVFAVAMGNTMDASVRYGGVSPRLLNLAAPFDENGWNQPENLGCCLGVQSEEINLENAERTADEFAYYLNNSQHFVGIKLYPGYNAVYVNDRRHWPLFELARAYNVPVVIHTGDTAQPEGFLKYSHPLTVDDAAVNFSDVTFVIAHCGNPWITDAAEVAAKNPNVCLDVSGLLAGNPKPFLLYAKNDGYIRHLRTWLNYLDRYDKVMYGSDWPLINIPTYLHFISYVIPEQYHEAVFCENALRIFPRISALLTKG